MMVWKFLAVLTVVVVGLLASLHVYLLHIFPTCPHENKTGLATFDERGFVQPFGNLVLTKDAHWTTEFVFASGKRVSSDSIVLISLMKSIKYSCTGADKGTPDLGFRIKRNGEVVYETGIEDGGLQGSDFGYIEPVGAYLLLHFAVYYVFPSFLS